MNNLIFFILIFFHCSSPQKLTEAKFLKVSRITSFTGKNLTDGLISVYGKKNSGIFHITNEFERIFISLPYSEDWVFFDNPNSFIFLESEELRLTASVSKENSDYFISAIDFLKELKIRIESRMSIKFYNDEILNSDNNSILYYNLKNPETGYLNHHFWSIRQNKNKTIYKFHLSFPSGNYFDKSKMQKNILFLMDDGFKIY